MKVSAGWWLRWNVIIALGRIDIFGLDGMVVEMERCPLHFGCIDNFGLDGTAGPEWWMELAKHVMEVDNSWNKAAGEYLSLYDSVRVR